MQLADCDAFFSSLKQKSQTGLVCTATIEFTSRCNLRCSHCYCTGSEYRELDLDRWKRIADKLYEEGCLTIAITGGEPLLRADFSEFYLYLKKKGFLVCLLTNATLIDEAFISLMQEYPPILIDISVYGSKSEVYDRVTCSKGGYGLLRSALDRLKKGGVPFNLKTMILKENLEDIEDIAEIAKVFAVDFRVDPALHPRRNGDSSCLGFAAPPRIAADKEHLQATRKEAISKFFLNRNSRLPIGQLGVRRFLCSVDGRTDSAFIRPDGGIAPCSGLAWRAIACQIGQSIGDTLKSFWENFNRDVAPHPRLAKCSQCEYLGLCSFCPAADYPTGNLSTECEYWYSLNECRKACGKGECFHDQE